MNFRNFVLKIVHSVASMTQLNMNILISLILYKMKNHCHLQQVQVSYKMKRSVKYIICQNHAKIKV